MVERIMLFKLHESERRAELARALRDALVDLEGLEDVSVGLPADPVSAKSWDMSLVLLFASEAVQNLTLASDGFKNAVERRFDGVAQVVKAWSFERLA